MKLCDASLSDNRKTSGCDRGCFISMKEHLRMKTEYHCLKQPEKNNNVRNERPMKLGLMLKFFPFGLVPTYKYILQRVLMNCVYFVK